MLLPQPKTARFKSVEIRMPARETPEDRENTMMKVIRTAATVLVAAYALSGAGASAFAQTGSPPATADQPASGSQEANQDSNDDRRAPVLQVTSVEVLRSTHEPVLDVVRVRGLTSTAGWDEAELVPLTHAPSSDGILDLVFVARTPNEAQDATGFATIEAIFPIEPGHPYKGVRIHGATSPVTLKTLPGYAEAAPVQEDCGKCVGKYFVPKGATLPDGKTEAETVKQEHLPPTVRIIKTSDGIANLDSDPNRLTLVLDDDGRIVTAVWD
jgi:hypothetical protein